MTRTKTLIEIPSKYKEFRDKTYIVLVDGYHCRILRGEGGILEELPGIEVEKVTPEQEDKYRGHAPGTTQIFKTDHENLQKTAHEDLFKKVADTLDNDLATQEFDDLIVIVPNEYKNLLKSKLSNPVQSKISRIIEGNYMKERLIQLVEKIQS